MGGGVPVDRLSRCRYPGFMKEPGRFNVLLLFLILISLCRLEARSVHVPLGHRVYDFLDRMETRGLLIHVKSGSRPFTRDHCAVMVARLDSLSLRNPADFTRVDRRLLERLKGEFRDELQNRGLSISKRDKEPHFYSRRFDTSTVHIDVLFGGELIRRGKGADPSEREINRPHYGAILRGNYRKIGFYSENRIYSEWGSRTYVSNYSPAQGYPMGAEHDSSRGTWDVSESHVTFQVGGVDFSWGRDRIAWGPARTGLIFSGKAPAFDLFSLRIPIGPAVFTWLHGELRSDFSHRWIAAHRLEVSLRNNLNIGVNEGVVYGRRGMESAYLIPILPYLTAEHTLGDRDNLVMGLDVNWRPFRNWKLYGDFFIDDLFAPWELFGNFYGNKLAFTIGLHRTNVFRLPDTDLRCEYTRIEPYVYTHKDPVNIFEHYDQGLGHFLHPNSDRLWIETIHRPCLAVEAGLFLEAIRRGAGDRRISDAERQDDTKRFLDGTILKTVRYGIFAAYEPFRDLFFRGEWIFVARRNQQWISGAHADWFEARLSLNWNW